MLEKISLDKITDKRTKKSYKMKDKKCSIRTTDKITIEIRIDIYIYTPRFTVAHLVSAIMLLTLKQISPL